MTQATLLEIKLLQKARTVKLVFDTNEVFQLSCEYLRVFSPSAEVKGHAQTEGLLVTAKQMVNIIAIEPIGHYAVRFVFDDGHQTGLYSWDTLYTLARNYEINWQHYLERVEATGATDNFA